VAGGGQVARIAGQGHSQLAMQAAVQHRGRVDASEEQERWSGLWLSAFWRLVEWWLSLCVTA
jgi:hypothetical protein